MKDPVIAADKHTYERKAITEWLQKNKTSPKTGVDMSSSELTPDFALAAKIAQFKDNFPDIIHKENTLT